MFGFFENPFNGQGTFNTQIPQMPTLGMMSPMNLAGECRFCGLNLLSQHPLYNVYPHMTGACRQDVATPTEKQDDDAEFLRKMGIKA